MLIQLVDGLPWLPIHGWCATLNHLDVLHHSDLTLASRRKSGLFTERLSLSLLQRSGIWWNWRQQWIGKVHWMSDEIPGARIQESPAQTVRPAQSKRLASFVLEERRPLRLPHSWLAKLHVSSSCRHNMCKSSSNWNHALHWNLQGSKQLVVGGFSGDFRLTLVALICTYLPFTSSLF